MGNGLVKVYATRFCESDDSRLYYLVKTINKRMEEAETIDDLESLEKYRRGYKKLCSDIRNQLNLENVIGFVIDEKKIELTITIYNVRDTGDNFYQQIYDPEEKCPYILAREEDILIESVTEGGDIHGVF